MKTPALPRAYRADARVPVLLGHADIAHQDVWTERLELGHGRPDRWDSQHLRARTAEHRLEELARVLVVVDREDAYAVEHVWCHGPIPHAVPVLPRRGIVQGKRECHGERGSTALPGARGLHRPPVQLHQLTHAREPEPEPTLGSRRRALRLPEAIEDAREELRGHAAPGVFHMDPRLVALALEPHADAPSGRRELHR